MQIVDILKVAIDEERRVYDQLCEIYNQLTIKTLAFLGGGLALLTFLYSSGNTFIPSQVYGKIFYFAGLGLFIFALVALIFALRPRHWEFPTEMENLKDLNSGNEKAYLEYVKNRYLTCYEINSKACDYKQKLLNTAFYPLVFGAIILLVLNLFGD